MPTCTQCHGSADNPAPPRSTNDASDTADVTVGAHQSHLRDGTIRAAIACQECHVVPTTVNQAGHVGSSPAEITWGTLATFSDASPTWDRTTATCTDTYCHGATLGGGSNKAPQWTTVNGTQAVCGTCHGAPPPPPHAQSSDCASCHPLTMDGAGGIDIDGGMHINGVVEVGSLVCNSCHGSGDNNAPPTSTEGDSATTALGVGAHQSHLTDGAIRQAIPCQECHQVPTSVEAAGHTDTPLPAELTWGTLATTDGATPLWDRTTTTCSNTYCHGVTLGGGTNKTPDWTVVNGSQSSCGSCHGVPPPPPHPTSAACWNCHPDTIDQNFTINPDTHIDGILQVVVTGQCDGCHGAPPATGSHLVHYGGALADVSYGGTGGTSDLLPGGGAYAFGCGNCHPMDPSHHMNGVDNAGGGRAEIDLSPVGAPPTSLKARNATTATYTPGSSVSTDSNGYTYTLGSCDGVYCHSSKEVDTPSGVPAPGVDFPFVGYPIVYPAYTVDATRSYSVPTWGASLSCDGCHGFPPRTEDPLVEAGAGDSHSFIDSNGYEDLHGWNHGSDPIPCATCHNDTVTDHGVRWRDYVLPADGWSVYEPVPITGHTDHVNGLSDVAFTTSSATVINGTFSLSGATWDASTLSCDNVGCHILQTSAIWGTPYRYNNTNECNVCHQM